MNKKYEVLWYGEEVLLNIFLLAVTTAKFKHLEFGLACYANVFIMLSFCLSASTLDPVRGAEFTATVKHAH